jgi:hypothetical protein
MEHIEHLMNKNFNKIAAIEKAISEKYGEETIQNPKANWDENKEKEYLEQMKALYQKTRISEQASEKIDVNGIKVSKKLLNRESTQSCPVCGQFPKKSMDNVCLVKFECCHTCYIKFVEGREERWNTGWRPNENYKK